MTQEGFTPDPSFATLEAEQATLGAILVRPEVLDEVSDYLRAEDFYREAHANIYRVMLGLYDQRKPVDLVTVTALLKEVGWLEAVGGPVFLASLSEQAGFATNAPYYAKLVREKSTLRQYQKLGQELIKESGKAGVEPRDLLLYLESRLQDLSSRDGFRSHIDIKKAIPEIGEFLKIQSPPRKIYLDPWLKEGSINLIAGWRGVGKTALTLALLNAASRGEAFGPWGAGHAVPCLYFDAEMTQQDLQERCEELYDSGRQGGKLHIFSDHYFSLLGLPTANLLDEKWRRWMKEEVLLKLGVKLWGLDNIGSVTPGLDENSREAWSPINRWLLDLRFLGIATILDHH
jgi:replicative DNA helicase